MKFKNYIPSINCPVCHSIEFEINFEGVSDKASGFKRILEVKAICVKCGRVETFRHQEFDRNVKVVDWSEV